MNPRLPPNPTNSGKWHFPWMLALCTFLLAAFLLLFTEHRAHVLGFLPYVLLLACPLMHLFMHHGRHEQHHEESSAKDAGGDGDHRHA